MRIRLKPMQGSCCGLCFGKTCLPAVRQARRVADRTAFMGVDISDGKRTGYLVEFGETEQVFEAPEEALTKEYMHGKFS